MYVTDIMTAKPVTITPGKTLRQALETMDSMSCHHLPVISAQGHLVGILSESDCRRALNWPQLWHEHWQKDPRVDEVIVRDAMTAAPITIEADSPAEEVARLMLTQRIGCLPVMRAETLIGIVTTSDILVAFMQMEKYFQKSEAISGR